MTLAEAVEAAAQKMAVDGIEGWGLWATQDIAHLFTAVQTGPTTGCDSETWRHVSHGAAAPTIRLVPVEGARLVKLGHDDEDTYYCLEVGNGETLMLAASYPRHYHASLRTIPAHAVPAYLLAKMAQPSHDEEASDMYIVPN